MHIASQPMTWKHQSINKQNYDHKGINKWKKVCTLVLIGTPCLLSYAKKVLDTRSWKPKQGWITKN